jgi:hypothetical protein
MLTEVKEINLFFKYVEETFDWTHAQRKSPIDVYFRLTKPHQLYLEKVKQSFKPPVLNTLKNSVLFFFDTLINNLLNAKAIPVFLSNIKDLFQMRWENHLQYLSAATGLGLSWEKHLETNPDKSILGLTISNAQWTAIAENFLLVVQKALALKFITVKHAEEIFPHSIYLNEATKREERRPDFAQLFFPEVERKYLKAKHDYYLGLRQAQPSLELLFSPIEREILAYLTRPIDEPGQEKKHYLHPSSKYYADYVLINGRVGAAITSQTFNKMWSAVETALLIIYSNLKPYEAQVLTLFEEKYKAEVLLEYACAISKRNAEVEAMIAADKSGNYLHGQKERDALTQYLDFRKRKPDVYKRTEPITGDREEVLLLAYARLNKKTIPEVRDDLLKEIEKKCSQTDPDAYREQHLEAHTMHFISNIYYKLTQRERLLLNEQVLCTQGLNKTGEAFKFVTVGFVMADIDFRLTRKTAKNPCSTRTWQFLLILLADYAPQKKLPDVLESSLTLYLDKYRKRTRNKVCSDSQRKAGSLRAESSAKSKRVEPPLPPTPSERLVAYLPPWLRYFGAASDEPSPKRPKSPPLPQARGRAP